MKPRRIVCSFLLLAPLAGQACELPPVPAIPGADESQRSARSIERDTERYLEGMVAYVSCVQAEFRAVQTENRSPLALRVLVQRNNYAVAEMEAVAELYEERVGPIDALDLGALQPEPDVAEGMSATTADILAGIEPVRCISVAGPVATRVVSDRAVLFYRRTGRIFYSNLDNRCPGLHASGGFSYEVRGGRNPSLCQADLIYATDSVDVAVGFGQPCNLGAFYEVTEAQADELLNPGDERRLRNAVVAEPVTDSVAVPEATE